MSDLELRKVVGDTDWPLAPLDRPWDAGAASQRIQDWARKDDGTLDPDKLKRVHFYWDEEKPGENITAYKLLFCDVIDGRVKAVPRAIFAIAAVLMGARGGADIPDDEQEAIKKKVETYYARLDRIPPWKQSAGPVKERRYPGGDQRQRDAGLRPGSYDPVNNTIEVTWTTGAPVLRQPPWGEEYIEELDLAGARLERLNQVGVLLAEHEQDVRAVIGRVIPGSVSISDGTGVAMVQLSDLPEDQPVVQKVVKGLCPGISVGYRVYREDVYGATETEPARVIVRDWEPYELSVVALPADAGARVRSNQEAKQMDNIEKVEPVAAAATPGEDLDKARAEAAMAERRRVAGIIEAATKLGLRDRADDLIREGVSLEEARKRLIDLKAAQDEKAGVTTVHVTRDEGEARAQGMVEYLLHRADPQLFPLTDKARLYIGASLLDMARESLQARGLDPRGLTRVEIAEMALRPADGGFRVRAGALSTSDFPYLLGAVSGKMLRKAYEEAPNTFKAWCGQRTVPDFKPVKEIMLSGAPDLPALSEGAEYTYGTLEESQETWSLATYGVIIAITREALLNDDLQGFAKVPRALGQAAARKESDIVYGLLTSNPTMSDGKTLFHADHGNLATGANVGAPSVATIAEARRAMRVQKDLNGTTVLNLVPKFIIVPAALEATVAQLLSQIQASQATNVVPAFIQSLTPIVEPRLDAASETAWYLAADPVQVDTIVYGYLEGQTGPYVETKAGWEREATEIKVRHDFGAGVIDFRGLYKNPGAS